MLIGRRKRQSVTENLTTKKTTQASKITSTLKSASVSSNKSIDYYDDTDNSPTQRSESIVTKFNETCEQYAQSFLKWMEVVGPSGWAFLNETLDGDDKVNIF